MQEQNESNEAARLRQRIRLYLAIFIIGLVISGLTAFPLVAEVNFLAKILNAAGPPEQYQGIARWIATVHQALNDTDRRYPLLFYGTDWLAFGHLVIALFFIGPWRDPVRNVFVLRAGVAACVLVWPLALICGPIRGIPFWWQCIDCSFGLLGMIPLLLCLQDIHRLESLPVSGRHDS